MRPVIPYVTAAALFGLGAYGVLRRRNAVLLLMAVELLLNAVNLILVTADTTVRAVVPAGGQVFTLFVIVLAAAEVGVGLAIVLQLYRLRSDVAVDTLRLDAPPEELVRLPEPDAVPGLVSGAGSAIAPSATPGIASGNAPGIGSGTGAGVAPAEDGRP